MPRQQMRHLRGFYEFPDDFPECLRRLKEASGLSWSELARRLGQPADHPAVDARRPTHLPLPAGPPGPGQGTGPRPPASQGPSPA